MTDARKASPLYIFCGVNDSFLVLYVIMKPENNNLGHISKEETAKW
jgi:hypothetical protein